MEISPLLHKIPFSVIAQADPTPQITPMEEDSPAPIDDMQDSPLETKRQPILHE
jgi:hypothetical protein